MHTGSLSDVVDVFPLVHGPKDRELFKQALRAQRRFDFTAGCLVGFCLCAAIWLVWLQAR